MTSSKSCTDLYSPRPKHRLSRRQLLDEKIERRRAALLDRKLESRRPKTSASTDKGSDALLNEVTRSDGVTGQSETTWDDLDSILMKVQTMSLSDLQFDPHSSSV